jgi:hypothetical protein
MAVPELPGQDTLASPIGADLSEVVHEVSNTQRYGPDAPYSTLPEVSETNDPALRELEAEMARLDERQTRLREVERTEAEKAEIRRQYDSRLAELRR